MLPSVSHNRAGSILAGQAHEFEFPDRHVRGFENLSRWREFAVALVKRGYPEEAVAGILGGNFTRVLRTVWGA